MTACFGAKTTIFSCWGAFLGKRGCRDSWRFLMNGGTKVDANGNYYLPITETKEEICCLWVLGAMSWF